MVEAKIKQQEEILRFRVRQYLKEQKWGSELKRTVNQLELEGGSVYVVGGFLRDLMIYGTSAEPRDFDVVFEGVSADKVEYLFWNTPKRKNRFGGMRLEFGDCPFDVWSLKDTWAFRNRKVHQVNVSALRQTTFLNIDAIVFKLGRNSEDEIFSNGFFEGISTRTLEINLEDNPFPETCIVRSLLMASKLKFAIGPRLASYISHYSKNASLTELQRIQKTHYGFVELDGADLRFCFDAIKSQLRCPKKTVVFLPQRQLKFEGASLERERRSESKVKTWISKISEIAFVNTKYVRQLRNRRATMGNPSIFVFNIPQKWLKKAQ